MHIFWSLLSAILSLVIIGGLGIVAKWQGVSN